MPDRIVIVGAGLAGACVAAMLARVRPVTVLELAEPGAGASEASAGLINPFPGRRAAPAWRHAEALEALAELAARAGIVDRLSQSGLLRPARDARQAEVLRKRVDAHPDELEWIGTAELVRRWPAVAAPHGGLWVRRGGRVDVGAMVRGLLRDVEVRPRTRVVAAGEGPKSAWVELEAGERLEGEVVLLAPGPGFPSFPQLAELPLQRVKGQTVRVQRPDGLGPIPLLAGCGYVVPEEGALVLGSTYEHFFSHEDPTAEGAGQLLRQAARMVPSARDAAVLEGRAGIRVTVPSRVSPRRLPMAGPLPGHERLWCLTGLGSKGLMAAPLIARKLPAWLDQPSSILPVLRPRIDAAA